jgi:hypothetical protein
MRTEFRLLKRHRPTRKVLRALLVVLSLGLTSAVGSACEGPSNTSYPPGLDQAPQRQTTLGLGNLAATTFQIAVTPLAPVPLYYCPKLDLGGERRETIQTQPGRPETRCFKVYVPDRWGGKLTITTTAGTIKELKFPDGSDYANGSDTKLDKQGWFTFKIESDRSYTVSNTFVQEGKADTVPWNFFYFPFLATDTRPHLYDNPGAYTKLDSTFNLGGASLAWETANHKSATAANWEGHCWGASLASIILEQPQAAGGFTQEELEGLAGEFFNESGGTNLLSERLPKEIPTAADTDRVDPKAHRFHNGLRKMLRTKKMAVHINLRQARGTGADDEVWNQGCHTYKSSMREDPDAAGDTLLEKPFQIKITTSFTCNDDFVTPEDSTGISTSNPAAFPNGRREQESKYILMYGGDGEVIPNGTIAGRKQNWLTMTLKHTFKLGDVNTEIFVPRSMYDVTSAGADFRNNYRAENIDVTGARLIQLGFKKNKGF